MSRGRQEVRNEVEDAEYSLLHVYDIFATELGELYCRELRYFCQAGAWHPFTNGQTRRSAPTGNFTTSSLKKAVGRPPLPALRTRGSQ